MSAQTISTGQKRDLTSGPVVRTLMRLAAPLAVGALLQSLYSVADAFWLGRWSAQALAAPGVSMPFMFMTLAMGMGFGTAGTAMMSQYVGAGQEKKADEAAAQTLLLLFIMGVIFAGPLYVFTRPLLALMQVPPDVLPVAVIYLRVIAIGLPLVALKIGYEAVLRALGDTMPVLLIVAISAVLNIGLDPFLIFGWGPFPAMGAGGAALATLVSQLSGVACCYVLLRRGRAGLHVKISDFRPNWSLLRRIIRVGVPIAVTNGSNSLGFAGYNVMINALGTATIGAFTIGFRITHLLSVPNFSTAMATGPLVGQALGAGKPDLAKRAVWAGAGLLAVVMIVPYGLVIWQGQLVARAFTADAEVIEEAGWFFLIVPASSYFFGALMVLTAAFYGSGDTVPPMVVSLLRAWVLRIPAAYLLGFTLGMGSSGVYLGMVFSNVVCAIITLWLFLRGRWQRTIIDSPEAEPPGG